MTAKIQAVAPRLSDEDPDPIEQDEVESVMSNMVEGTGYLQWSEEDIADIKRLIHTKMPDKPRKILEAFLRALDGRVVGNNNGFIGLGLFCYIIWASLRGIKSVLKTIDKGENAYPISITLYAIQSSWIGYAIGGIFLSAAHSHRIALN
jgi:hypothetical protein